MNIQVKINKTHKNPNDGELWAISLPEEDFHPHGAPNRGTEIRTINLEDLWLERGKYELTRYLRNVRFSPSLMEEVKKAPFYKAQKQERENYVLHALKEGLRDLSSVEDKNYFAVLYEDSRYLNFFRCSDKSIKNQEFLKAFFSLKNTPEHIRGDYKVIPVDITGVVQKSVSIAYGEEKPLDFLKSFHVKGAILSSLEGSLIEDCKDLVQLK